MHFNKQLDKLIFRNQHKRLLDESLLDVRQKNAKNLSDEQFQQIMSYDPNISQLPSLDDVSMANTNESFSRWLLKMYKSGELQDKEPQLIQKLLSDFERAKKRRNLLPNNDINSYKKIDDLQNALSNIDNNLTINQKNKDARKAQNVIKKELKPGMYLNGGAELLYTNNDWEVWTPHTYEGSKALRHGAVWCTGGDTPGFYNSYTEDGQLYIIINKNDKNEKYQLFVPFAYQYSNRQREFRDKDNESLKFREFVHNNNLVDFFLTQDNVTNSYENLDDPNIDDEWDEDKELEIMYEYNLDYDDGGLLYITLDYNDLIRRTYYTTDDEYKDFASNGYLEDGIQNWEKYVGDVIAEDDFIDEVDWKSTDLMELYKFFKKDSGLTEYTFEDFIGSLFEGASHYDSNHQMKSEIFNWFNNRENNWEHKVRMSISQSYLDDPYISFIYNSLKDNGWDPPTPDYNSRFGYNRENRYQNYLDKFKNNFIYTLDDCHTVQEFYEEYADRGNKDYRDVIDNLDIGIYESMGDIDTSDCDWSNYSDENASYDAKSIVDIFMSKQEWNDFISSDYDENENNSENNDEDSIRVSENDNYIAFHDDKSIFYVSKKDIDEKISYYNRWNEIDLHGLPSEIIREQIAILPTQRIKEILMKYSDLNNNQKESLEKVSDNEKINEEYLYQHLYTFIGNILRNYIKVKSNKKEDKIDESLFEPDW